MEKVLPVHIALRSFPSTHMPRTPAFIKSFRELVNSEEAWSKGCSPFCKERCEGRRPLVGSCLKRERSVYGWLNNWKVNPCLANCPLWRMCWFRKYAFRTRNNARYGKVGDMKELVRRMDWVKVEPLGPDHWKIWTPRLIQSIMLYPYINPCNYLIQRFIVMAKQELPESLVEEMKLVTGELTSFKDSLAEGDRVVLHNVAYLLMVIELGKMRIGKLKSLSYKDKHGAQRFHPIVQDIKSYIKDAIQLMDGQGWTTAGERRLKGVENRGKREEALDLLEGRDFEVSNLPEKAKALADRILDAEDEVLATQDESEEEREKDKQLTEKLKQRVYGEEKTVWDED